MEFMEFIKNKFILLILVFLLVFIILLVSSYFYYFWGTKIVKLSENKLWVMVADSEKEREKGLSGRSCLCPYGGMLFLFKKSGIYSFWMKDMKFSLDFIWLKDHKIVEINENITPIDFQPPKTLMPNQEVDAVLEILDGKAKELNLQIGDLVEY